MLGQVLGWMINIYSIIILARVLLSWFPDIDPYSPPVQFLYAVTEPVLSPVRTLLRQQFPDMGMFDFSPIVVMVGLTILGRMVVAIF
ncbi:MAG TPA: YggT family protein [Aggregatilineales bacterium]|nr:YggT family protein [Aggregatilineales bacterium]